MADNRIWDLDGVHNFRDFGSYRTRDGSRLRSGRLWRSGQHFGASDSDLARITELDLKVIADLRGNSERASHPCRRGPAFASDVLFHDGETSNVAPHERASDTMSSAQAARERMRAVYRRIPYNPAMIDVYRRYFDALATTDGPSLVHCFAGKDRTGVAVALVHSALGVHRDDILHDYLLTNSATTFNLLREQAVSRAPERWGKADRDTLNALLGVDESYLAETFAEIERESGAVDAYLDTVLGVDRAKLEAMRALLVE